MKKSSLIALATILILAVGYTYAVEVTLLGPKQYERTTGKPNTFTDSFPGRPGQGKIILQNDGLSSAIVKINGIEIFGVNNFNKRVGTLEAQISFVEYNSISVELRSKPGAHLSIRILEEIDAAGAAIINPCGGVVSVIDAQGPYDGIRLEIPDGALNQATLISIGAPAQMPPIPQGFWTDNNPIEILPSGLIFNKPAALIIPANGIREKLFYTFEECEGVWALLDTIFSEGLDCFVVSLRHLSVDTWLCRETKNRTGGQPCQAWECGSTVTWKIFAPPNSLGSGQARSVRQAVDSAFRKWERALGGRLFFIEAPSASRTNIQIRWDTSQRGFNDGSRAYGITTINTTDPYADQLIYMNDKDYIWSSDNSVYTAEITSIEGVILHEIGHALGMGHHCLNGKTSCTSCIDDDGSSLSPVMANNFRNLPPCVTLTSDDISRVTSLYAACKVVGDDNLILNPSFEFGSGALPADWEVNVPASSDVKIWRDATQSADGRYSMAIQGASPGRVDLIWTTDFIDVRGKTHFDFSFWEKVTDTLAYYEFYIVYINQYDSSGGSLGYIGLPIGYAIRDWRQRSISNYGFYSTTAKVKISIQRSYSYTTNLSAIVFIDNLRLVAY